MKFKPLLMAAALFAGVPMMVSTAQAQGYGYQPYSAYQSPYSSYQQPRSQARQPQQPRYQQPRRAPGYGYYQPQQPQMRYAPSPRSQAPDNA